jgi:hypothetical protein
MLLVVLCVAVAGCSGSSTSTSEVTGQTPAGSTSGPVVGVPPIHTISLGNFQADLVQPGPHGLVLYGNPGTVGQPLGPAGGNAVYYYDFSSQQVETIATPTPAGDGTVRGIIGANPAGDWVVYGVVDPNQQHWELWAVNVVTHEHRLIDSAAQENSQAQWDGNFVTDGTNIVWSAGIEPNGTVEQALRDYNLAARTTQTLMIGPSPSTPFMQPLALEGNSLAVTQTYPNNPGQSGLYLWTLGQSSPQLISTEEPANVSMNDHYIVWDQPHTMSLTLYDRASGQITDQWVPGCIRPSIAADRPYVMCLDFDQQTYKLVSVPSGTSLSFFAHQASTGTGGMIGNDRAYWPATTANNAYSNTVDYFDLPTS